LPPSSAAFPLFRRHELAFRTQYAELKERIRAAERLLPGTPGSVVLRSATGRSYWYRVYQAASGKQAEAFVGPEDDRTRLEQVQAEMAFAQWVRDQVRSLRKLEFQVADKAVAQVLVGLYNAGLLKAGLCIVGTLAYMAWLNELGARAVAARTQDIDLAAGAALKLAAPASFLQLVQSTGLGFHAVPDLNPKTPPSSVKLPGAEGLRVDVLTHGEDVGDTVALPLLQWHAQTVPHYNYLLEAPREGAVLAGGHCIPVLLPEPERFVWHKLYSSATRRGAREKAAKDLRQALTLAAVLIEDDEDLFIDAFDEVPETMRQALVRRRSAILASLPEATRPREVLGQVLA
jgi:hypothetical protein